MDDTGETIDGTVVGEDAIVAGEPIDAELVLRPAAPVDPWYARPGVQTAAAATVGLIAGAAAFTLGRRLGAGAARSLAGRTLGALPDDGSARRRGGVPELRSGTYIVHIRIHARP